MNDLEFLLSSGREEEEPREVKKIFTRRVWVIVAIDIVLIAAALLIHFLWPASH